MKETAKHPDIVQTGLVFPIFQIRDLALRHTDGLSQLGLIQFFFFAEKPDFFGKSQFHTHHRLQFTIDAKLLLYFRQ